MGFLDKLFEKKCCDICGGEIGLMGNRKLADGNLCKECAAKLSPLFDERRQSTVEQIREQLLYRAENEGRVAAFNPTRTLGARTKVLIDDNAGAIIVTASSRWRDVNPDVIAFDQVTGCAAEVREFKTELREKKPDGTTARYDPPRYEIEYDVWVVVNVNSPYFDEIAFKTNDARLESRVCDAYRAAVREADSIRDALARIWEDAHEGLDVNGVFGMRLADIDAERRNEAAANAAMRMAAAAGAAPGVPGARPPMPPQGGAYAPGGVNAAHGAGIPVPPQGAGYAPGYGAAVSMPPQGVGHVAGAVNPGYPVAASVSLQGADRMPVPGGYAAPAPQAAVSAPRSGGRSAVPPQSQAPGRVPGAADGAAWFCPACGARCTERFCPSCGHERP